MTYVETFRVTVAANAIDTALGSLSPPSGFQMHILGFSWTIAGTGRINASINTDTRVHVEHELLADMDHPLPFDETIAVGETLSFRGSDTSGAPNLMLVTILYELLKAGT
jgi:hypothetical protein